MAARQTLAAIDAVGFDRAGLLSAVRTIRQLCANFPIHRRIASVDLVLYQSR